MPACTVTMPEALKAKTLYEQDYSLPQIAAQLNRSDKQIRTAFRHLGVPLRSRSEAQRLRVDRTGLTSRSARSDEMYLNSTLDYPKRAETRFERNT